jgi:hypothetical protein
MELSTREATSCTAIQELASILWSPKVRYHIHKSTPLSLTNPVHTAHPMKTKWHIFKFSKKDDVPKKAKN